MNDWIEKSKGQVLDETSLRKIRLCCNASVFILDQLCEEQIIESHLKNLLNIFFTILKLEKNEEIITPFQTYIFNHIKYFAFHRSVKFSIITKDLVFSSCFPLLKIESELSTISIYSYVGYQIMKQLSPKEVSKFYKIH